MKTSDGPQPRMALKARQIARRIARENPRARIAMTGCLAESEPDLLRSLPNVEWVLGNGEAKRPVNSYNFV